MVWYGSYWKSSSENKNIKYNKVCSADATIILQCWMILPFFTFTCHINLNTLKRKNYSCPFTILHTMWSTGNGFPLTSNKLNIFCRTWDKNAIYSCHFPLFLSFSKMWLMVLFFTNQRRDPCSGWLCMFVLNSACSYL